MRVGPIVTLPLWLLAMACGGVARTDAGSAALDAGGPCAALTSVVPDAGVFQAPPVNSLGTFQVTFHNHCAQTVWPAWASTGGLDNSIIDTQLWLPMSPASDRTVTVYGGVRELEFWGRTGCHFDQGGSGTCQTGDCGGFQCLTGLPVDATVFVLVQGFLRGYNVGLRVETAACGSHECVADVSGCSLASVVKDGCGSAIACSDICGGGSTGECCSPPGSGCTERDAQGYAPDYGDLVLTFCP